MTVRVAVAVFTSEPLVPFTVSVYVPVGVLVAVRTVRVELPEPVTEVGLNEPVEFAGRPLTLKVTTPLNPPAAVTVAVYVVLEPRLTLCDEGDTVSMKVGFVTTRVTVVVCVKPPLVPVMVKVYVPGTVEPVVCTVSVELAAGGTFRDVGFSVQVVLDGQPETVSPTVPLKPLIGATVAV